VRARLPERAPEDPRPEGEDLVTTTSTGKPPVSVAVMGRGLYDGRRLPKHGPSGAYVRPDVRRYDSHGAALRVEDVAQ
jgi:hypothetical protein